MSKTTDAYIAERKRAMECMIGIYCKKEHGSDNLCEECRELRDYAFGRIEECGNNISRTRCKGCPGQCYSGEMRERIEKVSESSMAGMLRHPFLYYRQYVR